MTNIIKHTELADFFVNESGKLDCTLNIDFKKFSVSKDKYFNGDNKYSEKEYEVIYFKVVEECNKSGEYTIDDFKGLYTVRKIDEIAKIHYDAMSDEDKKAHDERVAEELKQARISELKDKLQETDYIVIKIAEGEATVEDYTEVLANRKAWRAEINELEG